MIQLPTIMGIWFKLGIKMSLEEEGSVTGWLRELKDQQPDAQSKIWHRFVSRLTQRARRKLGGIEKTVVDAEDIVSMAFYNFFEKSPLDFRKLVDREDLWQILAMLADRRAADEVRKWYRRPNSFELTPIDCADSSATAPDADLILADEVGVRLGALPDKTLRDIAIGRLEGRKNHEIADKLDVSLRTVERKVGLIREMFESAVNQS